MGNSEVERLKDVVFVMQSLLDNFEDYHENIEEMIKCHDNVSNYFLNDDVGLCSWKAWLKCETMEEL